MDLGLGLQTPKTLLSEKAPTNENQSAVAVTLHAAFLATAQKYAEKRW